MEEIHEHEIELKLRRISEIKDKLSIANCFNPTRAEKMRIKLYKKQIQKSEDELKKLRNEITESKTILPESENLIW